MRWIIFICSLFISGCTVPEVVYFYNNTGSDVSISIPNSSGDQHEVAYRTSVKIEIGALLQGDEVMLSNKSTSWRYKLQQPSEKYWTFIGFGPFAKIAYKFQIENDKKIYVLEENVSYSLIVDDKTAQPEGYPLEPETDSGKR